MYVKETMARAADKKIIGAAAKKTKVYPLTLILILGEGVLGSDQISTENADSRTKTEKSWKFFVICIMCLQVNWE